MNRRNFIKSVALASVAGGASVLHADAAERTVAAKKIRSFNPDMRYRTFGRTGEKVSVLGFGTMRMPVVGND